MIILVLRIICPLQLYHGVAQCIEHYVQILKINKIFNPPGMMVKIYEKQEQDLPLLARVSLNHESDHISKQDICTACRGHIIATRACERGLDLMIVSSLCLIHSESFHGFCHFHLN
jgi:hypothetical protein